MRRNLAALVVFGVIGSGAFASGADSAALPTPPVADTPHAEVGTPRQRAWLAAGLNERQAIAEQLGEAGAREYARARGWTPLVDGTASTFRQGFDQVWQDAAGLVHVVEAKGGTSALNSGYGFRQGTAEWAVKAAEATIKSPSASEAERSAAKRVLQAAKRGEMQVHVIRTPHVLGEPGAAVVEATKKTSSAATKLAKNAIKALSKNGVVFASATKRSARLAGVRGAARVAAPVALAIEARERIGRAREIEDAFESGTIDEKEREVQHAQNAGGAAGGWAGAWAGASAGAWAGGAAGSVVPGPGTVIGAGAGAIAGGVVGYFAGEEAGAYAARVVVRQVHDAGTTVAEVLGTVGDSIVDAADAVGSAVSDAGRAVIRAGDAVATATGDAARWTGRVASRGWRYVFGD
ncbi:MAG: hypothetical protein H6812_08910 [Phycisphaeraceae bacterium]|nr:hypothetical protein [Phycisphaerales bacterium]MCB9843361.1 hypothetical protein [Phycisphaeraceae bacterium]